VELASLAAVLPVKNALINVKIVPRPTVDAHLVWILLEEMLLKTADASLDSSIQVQSTAALAPKLASPALTLLLAPPAMLLNSETSLELSAVASTATTSFSTPIRPALAPNATLSA
jgi:hypothetical protein